MRKKLVRVVLATALCCLFITGCGKEAAYVVNPVDGGNFNPSNREYPIMKGETGYYFTDNPENYVLPVFSLKYFDIESQQNVYLCNRPECLHEGDAFCTAVKENYGVMGEGFYDGKLYFFVDDYSDENSNRMALLRAEPDGSGLTEVAEICKILGKDAGYGTGAVFIHRGVCFLSYATWLNEGKILRGTYIYNLVDGSLSSLPEYEFQTSMDGYASDTGEVRGHFFADGAYVYYNDVRPVEVNKKIKSRYFLCRYNIETGLVEEAELEGMYKGVFAVMEPGKIAYSDSFDNLYIYDWDTKTATCYNKVKYTVTNVFQDESTGESYEWQQDLEASIRDMIYRNGKLIIMNQTAIYQRFSVSVGESEFFHGPYNLPRLFVLNEEMQVEDAIELTDLYSDIEEELEEFCREQYGTTHAGFEVYATLRMVENQLYLKAAGAVYVCDVEEFFQGTARFQHLYDDGNNLGLCAFY